MMSVTPEQIASLRVGMCQVSTKEWDIQGNHRRLMESLEEAGRQGAELAITPECVLHGYGSDKDRERLQERLSEASESLDGPRIGTVRECARRYRMDILLGFAERGSGARIHNSAALITGEGEIEWVYRKVHCRIYESAEHLGAFSPGDRFFVSPRAYEDRTFRIGAMICFDREVAESVRCLRSLGAELIACPLATKTYDLFHPQSRADNELITRCRAAENELFIAVINHAGRYNGGSFIVGPTGEPICQLGADEEVRTMEVPVGQVAARFHQKPHGWMGWGYRRPQVYERYLSAGS
jgi:predicted amidohydrolase